MDPRIPYRGAVAPVPPDPPLPWTLLALELLLVVSLAAARGVWVAGLRGSEALRLVATAAPLVALASAAVCVLWALPRGVYLALRRRRAALVAHLAHTAPWITAAVLTAGIEHAMQRHVDRRMESVVTAVERFTADRGRYPVRLDDVVPRYLSSVPAPWPLHNGCGFNYVRTGERVQLLRDSLDDTGRRLCDPQHGLRYRFLLQRWEAW